MQMMVRLQRSKHKKARDRIENIRNISQEMRDTILR